jgi:predicted nucleotidyltransferase component of viral defense system
MKNELYLNTISPLLIEILNDLMGMEEFEMFRLVGGTALSLQIGHRLSVDIDLFTDAEYGTVNFDEIDDCLKTKYQYVSSLNIQPLGMGKSYFIGNSQNDCIKLDLYYTDEFINKALLINKIRIASIEEIIAMKMDVILRGGRKKDFWDIHELRNDYTFQEMINLHARRYPYIHDEQLLKKQFVDFTNADNDFEPICLKGKDWEFIKMDLIRFADLK